MPSSAFDPASGYRIEVVPGWRKARTCRCPSLDIIDHAVLGCRDCGTVYGVFVQVAFSVGQWNEARRIYIEVPL
jgi:hypothetical protein